MDENKNDLNNQVFPAYAGNQKESIPPTSTQEEPTQPTTPGKSNLTPEFKKRYNAFFGVHALIFVALIFCSPYLYGIPGVYPVYEQIMLITPFSFILINPISLYLIIMLSIALYKNSHGDKEGAALYFRFLKRTVLGVLIFLLIGFGACLLLFRNL